jgi:hypothetical protein
MADLSEFLLTFISGMLAFLEWLKTKRWISLSRSSICYTPSDFGGVAKASYVGYLPRENCLMLDHTTMSLFLTIVLISLVGVFDRMMNWMSQALTP